MFTGTFPLWPSRSAGVVSGNYVQNDGSGVSAAAVVMEPSNALLERPSNIQKTLKERVIVCSESVSGMRSVAEIGR
jgi:hypothetical protein